MKIPEVEIRLENYYPAIVCLWPGDYTPARENSCSSYSESDVVTF